MLSSLFNSIFIGTLDYERAAAFLNDNEKT
jgi:hypothetical protein